jgi:uncharacterized repeat protein (TIGR03847 family)
MSESFEVDDPRRFTSGTVGPPGQRVFYIQSEVGGRTVSLKVEKAQVAAMSQYLVELMTDLPAPDPAEIPTDLELVEPVDAEWTVGQIGIAYDETRDRLFVQLEEMGDVDTEGEVVAKEDAGTARFTLTRGQVVAFVARSASLVASGRPPCPLCGRPLDPEGHMCIKTNGHKER